MLRGTFRKTSRSLLTTRTLSEDDLSVECPGTFIKLQTLLRHCQYLRLCWWAMESLKAIFEFRLPDRKYGLTLKKIIWRLMQVPWWRLIHSHCLLQPSVLRFDSQIESLEDNQIFSFPVSDETQWIHLWYWGLHKVNSRAPEHLLNSEHQVKHNLDLSKSSVYDPGTTQRSGMLWRVAATVASSNGQYRSYCYWQ